MTAATGPRAKKRPRIEIEIEERWCKGCGICVEFCPAKVFAAEPITGKAKVAEPERCSGCGNCELYCPDYAISLYREEEAE